MKMLQDKMSVSILYFLIRQKMAGKTFALLLFSVDKEGREERGGL